jgi:hypothetical protein
MVIIGIVLSVFGIGFFCWLLFTLAVYALPFFVAMTVGLAAYHGNFGVVGALLVGVLAAGATLAAGQLAFATVRTPLIRAAIALLFAAPAAVAGYSTTFGLSHIGIASQGWCQALAIFGAIMVGSTAWARMALLAPPISGHGIAGSGEHAGSVAAQSG